MEKKINIVALILKVMLITTVVIMAGCTKSNNPVYTSTNSGGSPGANEVWMQGIAFVPASKTISVGTTITWTNKDNTTQDRKSVV
jgi:plastocyanin